MPRGRSIKPLLDRRQISDRRTRRSSRRSTERRFYYKVELCAAGTAERPEKKQFCPMVWDAVRHRKQLWGYPISLEAIGLIYNKKLVSGAPPTQLSDLIPFHQKLKSEHSGVNSILWDYSSPYYSWVSWLALAAISLRKQPMIMIPATSEWPRTEQSRDYLRLPT